MSLNIDPKYWTKKTVKYKVPYKVLEGYPRGSLDEEEGDFTEQIIIQTKDFDDFIEESFSDLDGVYPGGNWQFNHARTYPRDDGKQSLFVTKKISFEPFITTKPVQIGVDNNIIDDPQQIYTYGNFLKLTIEYGVGKTTDYDDDLLERSGNATGEFIVMPTNSTMYWINNNTVDKVKDLNVPATQVVPGIEWSVKYRRIDWENLSSVIDRLRGYMGCVNSEAMPIFNSAPKETVLFAGFSWTTRYTWRSPLPLAEMEIKCLEKNLSIADPASPDNPDLFLSVGHNHFLNPKNQKWQYLYRSDGSKIYHARNLNDLFYRVN